MDGEIKIHDLNTPDSVTPNGACRQSREYVPSHWDKISYSPGYLVGGRTETMAPEVNYDRHFECFDRGFDSTNEAVPSSHRLQNLTSCETTKYFMPTIHGVTGFFLNN
jgi:hypothetical protein